MSKNKQSICIIGAGNVAWQISTALQQKGFEILQIYSRTCESSFALANMLNVPFTTNIKEISDKADFYIFAVKDDALAHIIDKLPKNNGIWLHTAGSVSIDIFRDKIDHFGVLYPLQTFNKTNNIDWSEIPLFLEASDQFSLKQIDLLARHLSPKVFYTSSEKRKYIHLSAVFACNFTNFMYNIAGDIIENAGFSFELLYPLIKETCEKVKRMSPSEAQTGPAVRYDKTVIDKQISLLHDENIKKIYKDISAAIHKYHHYKENK